MMHIPTIVEDADRPEDRPERLIGSGAAMQTVFKRIGRVAPQDVNGLILGESGTGKELVARAIYHHSRRNQAPFLAINCAAIPEPLLESELFGYERCVDGGRPSRIGKFEQAHGGTILLDEIGDMAPDTQAKILRLLQEGTFDRLGGSEAMSADVRIIAATNQDLDSLIERGRFRKDLYYRLRGVTITCRLCASIETTSRNWPTTFCSVSTDNSARPSSPFRPRRWSCWNSMTGRETCANCRASSASD